MPVNAANSVEEFAKVYVDEVAQLHGVQSSLVLYNGTGFTSHLWIVVQRDLGTKLHWSTTIHPQADGQTKRVNQVLEDMLRACILDFKRSCDDHISLIEFTYNNSFESSIAMAPYKVLYGRPYRMPIRK